MIADIKKNANSSEIKKYLTYCISPKKCATDEPEDEKTRRRELRKELKKTDRLTVERVAGFYSDSMEARPSQVDTFVAELDKWTRDMKKGKPATGRTPKCYMGSFAFSPEDDITPDRAIELTRDSIMEEMGGSYRPGVFVCHTDKDHLHVHFVVAAVGADGIVYDPQGMGASYRRFEMVMEKLETTHGFKSVRQRKAMAEIDPRREVNWSGPHSADVQRVAANNEAQPADLVLRTRVQKAYKTAAGDFTEFLDDLNRRGIRVLPNIKKDKSGVVGVAGLAFALKDAPSTHGTPAGDLGALFKWSRLSEKMHYDKVVHFERLQALRANNGMEVLPDQIQRATETKQPVALAVAPVDIADLAIALNAPAEGEWTQAQIDAAIAAGIETRDKKQAIEDAESIVARSLGLTLAAYRQTQVNPQPQHTDYSVGLTDEQEHKNEDEHKIK